MDNKDFINFLNLFGPFCFAVTINLKERSVKNQRAIAEKDAKYFVNMLNTHIFRRAFKYGHKALGVLCSFEFGEFNSRPHLHLAIGKPPSVSQGQLLKAIKYVSSKMKHRVGLVYIAPYYSDGWLTYITKSNSVKDVESLVLSASYKPKY